MHSIIKSQKDFWIGLTYIAFGAAALWFGADYRTGSAAVMGPGYFPKALAGILTILGLASVIRAFVNKGEPIEKIAFKPLVLVLAACALFGLVIDGGGLIVALLLLILVSAAASREFRFDWKASAGVIGLIAFCALVFVKGLNVPMPLIGRWLEPYVGPLLPWLG